MADMALRRSVLGQVLLPLVPPLVLIHAAEDERAYGALGRSAEAPATEPGFALQPADMEQVNCEIAYLETNEAAALAHRLPASCHSAEPYGRRAADDRGDEEGAASYGDGAAHYASSGAGASSSSAASTPSYTAAAGDGYRASAAGRHRWVNCRAGCLRHPRCRGQRSWCRPRRLRVATRTVVRRSLCIHVVECRRRRPSLCPPVSC